MRKERYAMKKDNVVELIQPGEFKDQLTEVLRQGAQVIILTSVLDKTWGIRFHLWFVFLKLVGRKAGENIHASIGW